MYYEHIQKITADHWRTHIDEYLEAIKVEFTGSAVVTLQTPTEIMTDSLVGGVFSIPLDRLPIYSVDALQKDPAQDDDGLYNWIYSGNLILMVAAADPVEADRQIKRHNWGAEKFIREHLYLHLFEGAHFRITGFEFLGSQITGTEIAQDENDPSARVWIAAAVNNVRWKVSEDSDSQHGL